MFTGDGSATLAGTVSGGAIDMAASSLGEYVDLQTGSALGATISGFTTGDAVDFEAISVASTDTVSYASGVVSIDNKGATVASFDVSGGAYSKGQLPYRRGPVWPPTGQLRQPVRKRRHQRGWRRRLWVGFFAASGFRGRDVRRRSRRSLPRKLGRRPRRLWRRRWLGGINRSRAWAGQLVRPVIGASRRSDCRRTTRRRGRHPIMAPAAIAEAIS